MAEWRANTYGFLLFFHAAGKNQRNVKQKPENCQCLEANGEEERSDPNDNYKASPRIKTVFIKSLC